MSQEELQRDEGADMKQVVIVISHLYFHDQLNLFATGQKAHNFQLIVRLRTGFPDHPVHPSQLFQICWCTNSHLHSRNGPCLRLEYISLQRGTRVKHPFIWAPRVTYHFHCASQAFSVCGRP